MLEKSSAQDLERLFNALSELVSNPQSLFNRILVITFQ